MKQLTLTSYNFMDYHDPATGKPIQREGNVVIPEVVVDKNGNKYQIVAIGDDIFYSCKSLTSITIPNSVTEIGFSAFAGCKNLTSITIPDSVTKIGDSAFSGCSSLTSITIPDSVIDIGIMAFLGCKNLTTITIPDGVTKIGEWTFSGCESLTSVTIPDSVIDIGYDPFSGCPDDLVITYRGYDYTLGDLHMLSKQSDGLGILVRMNIMSDAADILGDNSYSLVLVSKLVKAEHNGCLKETHERLKHDFQLIGFYDINSEVDITAKNRLTILFRENTATRGVVPKIIDALTIASTELGISEEKIVTAFEDRKFRDAVAAMRSCHEGNRFFDVEAALFAMNFDVNAVKNVILENPHKDYVSLLLCEGYQKKDVHLLGLAKWIGLHPDVSPDLVKDIVQYRSSITLNAGDNVDTVKAQLSKGRAMLEIQAIENDYDGFQFSDCVCRLPKAETDLGNYKAYIMDADDPRQVMIGYDTDCCQHYGGAGETAMMYGLVNPDAGFFVIEDKDTGKIMAQAEVWERTTKSGNKQLVFDNIEFADDRQIDQFAPVLAKWCENAPYDKILMGNGYNEMENSELRHHKGVEPPMTDELYDLFDGDEPYTDADEDCSILKAKGEVKPYLAKAYDRYIKDHQEEHSLFTEPTEEDLEEFQHNEPEQIVASGIPQHTVDLAMTIR